MVPTGPRTARLLVGWCALAVSATAAAKDRCAKPPQAVEAERMHEVEADVHAVLQGGGFKEGDSSKWATALLPPDALERAWVAYTLCLDVEAGRLPSETYAQILPKLIRIADDAKEERPGCPYVTVRWNKASGDYSVQPVDLAQDFRWDGPDTFWIGTCHYRVQVHGDWHQARPMLPDGLWLYLKDGVPWGEASGFDAYHLGEDPGERGVWRYLYKGVVFRCDLRGSTRENPARAEQCKTE
jgi:hypothetical protein